MATYRFTIESPYAGVPNVVEDVEFDQAPTDQDVRDVLDEMYATNYPAGYVLIDDTEGEAE